MAFNIQKAVDQCKSWKNDLKRYWGIIEANNDLYEFSATRAEETKSDISLNTPFSIVEGMVSKANDSNMHITVSGKGENDLDDFGRYIATILKDSIEDYDIQAIFGSFRKKKEEFFRDFLVKGNAIAKVDWYYEEGIADNPYITILNYKKVIFNPASTLDSSNKYYIESNVKMEDLEAKAEKDGKGFYKNISKLKEQISVDDKNKDDDDSYDSIRGTRVNKKVAPIKLLECWDGAMYRVIANDKVLIREEYDPLKIRGNNLIIAMNYKVNGRPYAYGEIDAIYSPTMAQDTIINQSIDMTNRYLRPSILVDANSNTNLDELIMIIEEGGVMQGNPQMIGHVPMQTPPRESFQTIDILQQAIERAARYSPYSMGMPSQQTDKTEGTKGGINTLTISAEPNYQIKQDALQESFAQPIARMYLKMIAQIMGENDIRYGLMKGKDKGWVKASKNILLGKATLVDLFKCGFITKEDYEEATTEEVIGQNGQPIIDPQTGAPMRRKIEGIEEVVVFDVDWVIMVKLDSKSAADKEKEIQQKISIIQLGAEMGVKWNPERTITMVAEEQGFEDVGELFLTEEEKKQIPPSPEEQQMQAEMKIREQEAQIKAQEAQMKIQAQQQLGQIKIEQEKQKMEMEMKKFELEMRAKAIQIEQDARSKEILGQQKLRQTEMQNMQVIRQKEIQSNQDLDIKKKQSVLLDRERTKNAKRGETR